MCNVEKELVGKSGIYCWTSPSGKRYIGQSKDLGSRHKDFRCASVNRTYAGENSIIDKARQKYKYSLWEYEVLEYCLVDQLDSREKYYIDLYNPEYNITKGGIGGCGVPKSAFKKGHKNTDEQKRKRKETLKKHVEEGAVEYLSNSKPVALYDKEGCFIAVFNKQKDCTEYAGAGRKGCLGSYIKNNNLLCSKYMVRYAEENIPLFIEPYKRKPNTYSPEAKEKMINSHKGKPNSFLMKSIVGTKETDGTVLHFNSVKEAANYIYPSNPKTASKNISRTLTGCKRTAYGYFWDYEGEIREHKAKCEIARGKTVSPETLAKIKEAAKKQMKPVAVYTLDGIYIETLPSARETSIKYNTNHVSQCCRGLQGSANGYVFKYV